MSVSVALRDSCCRRFPAAIVIVHTRTRSFSTFSRRQPASAAPIWKAIVSPDPSRFAWSIAQRSEIALGGHGETVSAVVVTVVALLAARCRETVVALIEPPKDRPTRAKAPRATTWIWFRIGDTLLQILAEPLQDRPAG